VGYPATARHFAETSAYHFFWCAEHTLLNLRIDPRLSVLATEQLVGLRVIDDNFLVTIPFNTSANLVRKHAQQAHICGKVTNLDITYRP